MAGFPNDPGYPPSRMYEQPLQQPLEEPHRFRGGGARQGAGGVRPAARPALVAEMHDPDVEMPRGGLMLYDEGDATINNGASADVCDFTLLGTNVGVLNAFIQNGVNLTTAVDATWTVKIGGMAVQGASRKLPLSNAASYALTWGKGEFKIILPPGARVIVTITVAAGGPILLGAQISGWQYPAAIRELYQSYLGY